MFLFVLSFIVHCCISKYCMRSFALLRMTNSDDLSLYSFLSIHDVDTLCGTVDTTAHQVISPCEW